MFYDVTKVNLLPSYPHVLHFDDDLIHVEKINDVLFIHLNNVQIYPVKESVSNYPEAKAAEMVLQPGMTFSKEEPI